MRRVLITGKIGLLAHHLKSRLTRDFELFFLDHAEFDLLDPELMAWQLAALAPEIVVNTAAYNLVDRCEIERDLSWAVNATGPEVLGQLCAAKNITLLHYSSDYVFDGAKKGPYTESDMPNPLNHYAAGKLAGEQAVLKAAPLNLVLRTSWIFGWHPTQTKTFVDTIIKAANEGHALAHSGR